MQLKDNLLLFFSFLKSNKGLFFSIILATTLSSFSISSIFFFSSSYKPQYIEDYMVNLETSDADIIFSSSFSINNYLDQKGTFQNLVTSEEFSDLINLSLKESFEKNLLNFQTVSFEIPAKIYYNDLFYNISIINSNTVAVDKLLEHAIETDEGQNINESAIIIQEFNFMEYNPSVSSLMNESTLVLCDNPSKVNEKNLTTNIYSKIVWNHDLESVSQLFSAIIGPGDLVIVLPNELFIDLLTIYDMAEGENRITIRTSVYFNHTAIDYTNLVDFRSNVNAYALVISDILLTNFLENQFLKFNIIIFSILADLERIILTMNFIIGLFAIPIILFSILLVDYSKKLFSQQQFRFINTLKTKGISFKQIIFLLILEYLLVLPISIPIGILLAKPLVSIILHLENPDIYIIKSYNSIISIKTISLIILFIFIFLVFIFIRNLFSIQLFLKTEQAEDKEYKSIFWLKTYTDFILIVCGIVIIIINRYLQQLLQFNSTLSLLFNGLAIFLVIFGTTLLLYRIMPNVIAFIVQKHWNSKGNFLSFSNYLFKHRKKNLSKIIVLFTLGISFVTIALNVSHSVKVIGQESAYFEVGADARINLSDASNITELCLKLPDEILWTEVTKLSFSNTLTYDLISLYVLDINTFSSVAFFKDQYMMGNLSQNLKKLSINCTAFTSLFTANNNFWIIGDNYIIKLPNDGFGTNNRTMIEIVETYTNWPFFSENQRDSNVIQLVISKTTAQVFNLSTNLERFILLKFQNIDFIDAKGYLEREVLTSNEKIVYSFTVFDIFLNEPFWFSILFSLNFIIILLIPIILILQLIHYFAYGNIRKREIELFKALGISNGQIIVLFVMSSLVITIISIILELIISFTSSAFLTRILEQNVAIPIDTSYSLLPILFINLIFIVINLLFGLITSIFMIYRKKDIYLKELEARNVIHD